MVAQLHLEPWGAGDLALLRRLLGDPRMMAHLGGAERPEKIAKRQASYARAGSNQYRVIDERSGRAVGHIGFWDSDRNGAAVYETGWAILPEFQGRGLAAGAARAIVDLARRAGAHRYLEAYPSVANRASNRVCEKAGFSLLGPTEIEYPPGSKMTCNVWRVDLFA